ncbi:hypothetical protein CEXT_439761 [Caerostris extrusa]|uniref:Uncharacterized protein n=1 Tax=Caerostris extrusa TaxID=172846 RepID=A0AAV4Y196_CAEEX|nr:hypothetical protein CEXT_439761 [Caerostris extrusa]
MQCNNEMEEPFTGQNLGSLLPGTFVFPEEEVPQDLLPCSRPSVETHVVMKLTEMLPHGMVEFEVASGVNYCGSSMGWIAESLFGSRRLSSERIKDLALSIFYEVRHKQVSRINGK